MQFNNPHISIAAFAATEAGKAILEVYGREDFQVENKADETPLTLADRKAHEVISGILTPLGLPVLSEEGAEMLYEQRRLWNMFWMVDPLDGTKEFIKRNGEFTVNIALIKNGAPVAGIIYVPVTGVLYLGEVGNAAWKVVISSLPGSPEEITQLRGKTLPFATPEHYCVVASRTHMSKETSAFVDEVRANRPDVQLVSRGSSLKLCMIAEGEASIYPRFGPTMEWDTAAGHAICNAAGALLLKADNPQEEITYNKKDLLNPWFIARRPEEGTAKDNNLHPDFSRIKTREEKEQLLQQKGCVVWMTGLSGSGKSTIAAALEDLLHKKGYLTQVLDGDNIRTGINNNLGFSEEDRRENIRRIAEVSKLFLQCGIICINSFISPTHQMRQMACDIIGRDHVLEIYVNAPLEVCEERDVKGLYSKARQGKIKGFTGIDSPFEPPTAPDLEIRTDKVSVEDAAQQCLQVLETKTVYSQ